MSTSKRTWVKAESFAASLFGAKRRPLSGSANRPDLDNDDAIHPRVFVESKLRAAWQVWSLYRKAKALARKAGKVTVLVLREKHKQGAIVAFHSDDFPRVVTEYLAALEPGDLNAIEWAVAKIRNASEEDE